MKTHTFGNVVYAIWDKYERGGVWMVQFIWGKKDFRIYLERATNRPADYHGPLLATEAGEEQYVSRLQYLNNFEWYDYAGVVGHGLSLEEVRWRRGRERRYVELPRNFYATAVEIACREFGLTVKQWRSAA